MEIHCGKDNGNTLWKQMLQTRADRTRVILESVRSLPTQGTANLLTRLLQTTQFLLPGALQVLQLVLLQHYLFL